MATAITNLTKEMLDDYKLYSGKNIQSPEEYMIFRKQAIAELNMNIENKVDVPVSQNVETIQKEPIITKDIHKNNVESQKISEVNQSDEASAGFLSLISKIEG